MPTEDEPTQLSEEAPASADGVSYDRIREVADQVGERGTLARYDMGDRLGKGGVGEVVSARDQLLRRGVALKRLATETPTEEQRRRFVLEAQLTAQLEHPNIVAVHDLGLDPTGQPWFTMVHVRGRSLHQLLRAGLAGTRDQRLRTFLKVCDAISYAHSRGIIHRDLKPGNVMVGEHGQVVVLDWGLATRIGEGAAGRRIDADAFDAGSGELTDDDAVIGTPMYMAPEQAEGLPATHRSDIYALGALLYTLLAGEPPFERGQQHLLLAVRAGRRIPLRKRVPRVPRELDSIVDTAMRTDPMRRYGAVEALAADVEAFLDGREVAAHRYGLAQRLSRWLVRHRGRLVPWLMSMAAGAALVLLTSVAWVATAAIGAHRARTAEHDAHVREIDARVLLALSESGQGQVRGSRQALAAARQELDALGGTDVGIPRLRADLVSAWVEHRHPRPLMDLSADLGDEVGLSDDGTSVILASPSGLVWMSVPDGRVLGRHPGPGRAHDRWVSGFVDGRPIAGWHQDDRWRLVDLSAPEAPPRSVPSALGSHVFDRGVIAGGWLVENVGATGRLASTDLVGDRTRAPLRDVWLQAMSPGGHYAVVIPAAPGREMARAERSMAIDLDSGAIAWDGPSIAAVPSDDGRLAWVDGTIVTVTTPEGEPWTGPASETDRLAFTTTGDLLQLDGHRLRRSGPTGDLLAEVVVEGAVMRSTGSFAFGGDGTLLTRGDGVAVWTGASADPRSALVDGELRALSLDASGSLALVGGHGLALVDVPSGRAIRHLEVPGSVRDTALSDDGTHGWAVADDALWSVDLLTGTVALVHRFPDAAMAVQPLRAGGVAVALGDGRITTVDASGAPIDTVASGFPLVWDLEELDDGTLLATDRREEALASLVRGGAPRAVPGAERGPAYRVAHRGELAIVGRHTPPLLLWERGPEGMVERCRLNTGAEAVQAVALSNDGTLVATGAYDGRIGVWDASSCAPVLALPVHDGSVTDLAFTPDGEHLVAVGAEGAMSVLDLRLATDLDRLVAAVPAEGWEGAVGPRLLDLARAELLRRNGTSAVGLFRRAAAEGSPPTALEAARAAWSAQDREGAREGFARAAAEGALPAPQAGIWAAALAP
ncbi:MAG: protein kinase [Myxococcales bacterium]|nr:protein kinase [Myxococcales bacterium]